MLNKILIGLIASVFCVVTFLSIKHLEEPIDGNILHLPLYNQLYANNIPLPWVNNSLMSSLMFRTLFLPDNTLLNFKPDLAAKYEVNEDRTAYHFHMQKDQKWSDGTIITPEDVIFSIETALQTSFISHLYISIFQDINRMEVNGSVLSIYLKRPHIGFLEVMAQFAIMPKHVLENENLFNFYRHDFWKNPVTSGMYMVDVDNSINDTDENNEFDYYSLIPNPYYAGLKPKIERVNFYPKTNNVKLDFYQTNNISDMVHFRAMRAYTEYEISMPYYRFLLFNMGGNDGFENPAMQVWNTRRAIAHAVHKGDLLYELYFNVGNSLGSVRTGQQGAVETDYNPERARVMLKEANYDFNRPLRLGYTHTDATTQILVSKLQKYLEDVGFIVEIKYLSGNYDLYNVRDYDVLLTDLAAFNPLEWYLDYDSSNYNMSKILGGKGEFDELLDAIAVAQTQEEIDSITVQLSKLGRETVYKVPLFTLNQSIYLNSERVQLPVNFVFGNSWYHFDYNFANWSIKTK